MSVDTARTGHPATPEIGRGTLRVAFYCDSSVRGGAEESLANLIGALSRRIDAVVVGTNRGIVDWIASHRPGATTRLLTPIGRKRDARAIAEHFRAIRQLRPDILHVNLNSPWASHWAILAGLAAPRVRVVAVEHLPRPAARFRNRIVKRLTTPRLAGYVAVGRRSATEIAQLSGVSPTRLRTIYNGVVDVELEPMPRPSSGPVIGSLGRLEPQKGFDVLVRALPALPGVTAVLVGEGSERNGLVELAGRLGVSERLVLPGWSDQPRRYLTTFDVLVVPSRFEALPMVLGEAMLAGLPVVASDVGSVAEAVVDGRTGLLVPTEDPEALAGALSSLLGDPRRREEMGRRGRERALDRFSAAAMADAYEALYEEVVR